MALCAIRARPGSNTSRETGGAELEASVEAIVSAINFDVAFKVVQEGYYGEYFERGQNPEAAIANAEKNFRKAVLRFAKSKIISEAFNIGSTLSFITTKEAEVHNLRALSLGIEADLKPETIRNQLLMV